MPADRLLADYWLETPLALEDAAASMAGEQSTGTFTRVAGETDALREQFAARVEWVRPEGQTSSPSLPGTCAPPSGSTYQSGQVRLSFSIENMGANLPTILATVAGNLFELQQCSGLRLLDVHFPESLTDAFAGPAFGVKGTRALVAVPDRPLVGTIIKPSVGLSPAATAELVGQLALAGLDFVKDDELMANPPHSPLEKRVTAVMREVHRIADQTGRQVMVAFNISDQLDNMLRHHDTVLAAGGTCVMVSLNSVGHAGVEFLRRRCQLPIHGHRNGWGMLTRYPALGMEFTAYQKFWRLAGVDHLHVNGLQNKFAETDDSVVRSIRACQESLSPGHPILPVISSGQWGGQAPETYQRTGTKDVLYLAGGGILGHPDGPAAGVAAIRAAWEAAIAGIPLTEFAQTHKPLAKSLAYFGKPTERSRPAQ